ncbi:unnamed protein product [Rhizophagus irregularis]|nr:unnamed protein product [Rhizophagus irregularis]
MHLYGYNACCIVDVKFKSSNTQCQLTMIKNRKMINQSYRNYRLFDLEIMARNYEAISVICEGWKNELEKDQFNPNTALEKMK